mgnify:CR=1 FL=1
MNETQMKHLSWSVNERGIAWIWLDCAEKSANTLSEPVFAEIETALDAIAATGAKGVVFASRKTAGFVAGADVEAFAALPDAAAARALVERGWRFMERLAAYPLPTVALIHGHCLGGGLELALACRARVAVSDRKTRLGLPEIMLGIYPGWGGMMRLPALIGPSKALPMMLTAKSVNAKRAKRIGLVDEAVPERVAALAAEALVLNPPKRKGLPLVERLWAGPLRALFVRQAEKQLRARVRAEHYPAPYAVLRCWSQYGGNPLRAPADAPASIESLAAHPTTKNLLRVFFLQERLKKFAKRETAPITRVHVIGAGVMGSEIAMVCAASGLTVTLQDLSLDALARAQQAATRWFQRRFRDDETALRAALDRFIPDPQGVGVAQADVIIEAVVEKLDVKQRLFAELEQRAKPDALLATNTSSLSLESIAEGMAAPHRLVGIHFFNPVTKMPLVEVVRGAQSDAQAVERALVFVGKIDKLPLPVRSAPGFLVNAVLAPYLISALQCVEAGTAPEVVDAALEAFGMPMGPIELVDTVGLDVALLAGQQLVPDEPTPPRRLQQLVQEGKLGKKTGEGYYRWEKGKAVKRTVKPSEIPEGLAERIIAPLIAATERCVAEGVVADADLADAGVIFGTGFAPFRGGPLHWRNTKDAENREKSARMA